MISVYLELRVRDVVAAAKNEEVVLLAGHAGASAAIRVGVGAALRFKGGVGKHQHFTLGQRDRLRFTSQKLLNTLAEGLTLDNGHVLRAPRRRIHRHVAAQVIGGRLSVIGIGTGKGFLMRKIVRGGLHVFKARSGTLFTKGVRHCLKTLHKSDTAASAKSVTDQN